MLEAGTKLGSYEILGLLGAGGMGEVYRARDLRLDREVAVKVLPQSLAGDAHALGRFEREAKAVAAIAHPNILAIYDFGTESGVTYAVMELLEGETLRERLEQGPLPPRKAAETARQVARALGAAHERGIVHRDLKPDNIFIGKDGRAKVLDFGLASARDRATASGEEEVGPTRTSLTVPGTVMGTVGYMAPEQIRGETIDHRADIFSFGCVLHEMITGHRAFSRDTPAETMTAILREEAEDLETTTPSVSPALGRVVRRCLEKHPEERFQSAQDLAFAIDNSMTTSDVEVPPTAAVAAAPPRRRAGWPIATAVGTLGLLAGLLIGSTLRPPGPAGELVRVRTLTVSGRDAEPTASPDGQIVAFRSNRDGTPRIWIKQLTSGGEEPLTAGPDNIPRFSPDGSTLLFVRDEGPFLSVYRQSLIGGQVRKLVEDAAEAAWSPDGARIAFLRFASEAGRRNASIGLADAQGGDARILVESDTGMYGLRWSPGGDTLVTVEASITGNNPDYRLVTVDMETGEVERVRPTPSGNPLSAPVWTADGALVFAEAGSLLGDHGDALGRFLRYDPATGASTTLFWTQHLFPMQGVRSDFTRVDIVRPGTLVFHRVTVRQALREVDLTDDERGGAGRVLTRTEGRDRQPVYSPDDRRVLFTSDRSGNLDLWMLDLESGALGQLTDDSAQDWDPGFTADGEQIVWSSDRGGHLEIWMSNADGSGARQLTRDGVDAENPTVTADGEWVVYWSANPEKQGVWKIRPDGTDATRLAEGSFMQPEVSPDGRHAAFISMELDALRNRILVIDTDRGEMVPFRINVPTPLRAGNIIFGRLRWLPGGEALAFVGIDERNRTGVYAQDFVPGEDTTATRRPLAGFSNEYGIESFGISPDGTRITLATLEKTDQLMLAEGVPGV